MIWRRIQPTGLWDNFVPRESITLAKNKQRNCFLANFLSKWQSKIMEEQGYLLVSVAHSGKPSYSDSLKDAFAPYAPSLKAKA